MKPNQIIEANDMYHTPFGSMSGDDIQKSVQDFVASHKGGKSFPVNHNHDTAVSDYHRQQDQIERQARDDRATSNMREEEAPARRKEDRPWRKDGTPLNKPPSNPDYPTHPFSKRHWMDNSKKMEEDSMELPESGDTIRTRKSGMEGRVERTEGDEVYYRTGDGRLMKTPCSNAIVVQKLADCDSEMMEAELNEISNALLTKYKSAAGKNASAADAVGDIKTGNKRFSGIVKATNKQFANDAKKNVVAKEGMMGGINRCAPAQDVSYEKVLDRNPETAHMKVVGEEQVNELSVGKMQAYKDKASSKDSFRTRPFRKLAKSSQHVDQVNNKIAQKQGPTMPPKQMESYEDRLGFFVEADMSSFSDILGQQEVEKQAAAPRRKVVPIDYNGWTIKYRALSNPPQKGEKVDWVVYNHKNVEKQKGQAMSDKEAVSAAQEWINQGAGETRNVTSRATIDFNADFTREFGSDLYAGITNDKSGPALMVAYEPQEGLKKAHSRVTKDRETENTTKTLCIPMNAKECSDAGLQANTRYVLGAKDDMGGGLMLFPLIPHSVVQGKGDLHKLGKPGLTVGTERSSEA